MKKFNRPNKPDWYEEKEKDWTIEYADRKTMYWPTVNRKKLNTKLIDEFSEVNFFHCAYCDKITDIAEDIEIDHFVPRKINKTKTFNWNNLFFSCHACNKAKLAQFDIKLPKTDTDEYSFFKYFEFMPENGKIKAITEEGSKAIEIFKLNEGRRPKLRKKAFMNIRNDLKLHNSDIEIHKTRDYSFILDLIKKIK